MFLEIVTSTPSKAECVPPDENTSCWLTFGGNSGDDIHANAYFFAPLAMSISLLSLNIPHRFLRLLANVTQFFVFAVHVFCLGKNVNLLSVFCSCCDGDSDDLISAVVVGVDSPLSKKLSCINKLLYFVDLSVQVVNLLLEFVTIVIIRIFVLLFFLTNHVVTYFVRDTHNIRRFTKMIR
ncbi:hypothetical protein BDC45DRAFT_554544 [Circinella umbellata]|nr:hypothetical protein BDC45DRAFT_554544 [Circinella umbellata]